jgi:hypothetical protein
MLAVAAAATSARVDIPLPLRRLQKHLMSAVPNATTALALAVIIEAATSEFICMVISDFFSKES